MKAVFLNEETADMTTITAANAKLVEPRVRISAGKPQAYHAFPRGLEVEGDIALSIVLTGVGSPSDDECRQACGLSAGELKRRQLEHEMNNLGIHRPEDRELYKGGVILGYDDDKEYIKGPNWAAYQAALKANQSNATEE